MKRREKGYHESLVWKTLLECLRIEASVHLTPPACLHTFRKLSGKVCHAAMSPATHSQKTLRNVEDILAALLGAVLCRATVLCQGADRAG